MAFTPTVTWNGGTSSATGFNASPAGSADPRQGDDRIRELKVALAERLSREMYFALVGSSSAGQEGNLRQGAGRVYHTSSAPTTKPDGNALDADDVGRMYVQSNTTALRVRTSNNTWVAIRAAKATLADAATTAVLSSKANFVVDTGASTNLQCKILTGSTGGTTSDGVAHGLTGSKLRGVSFLAPTSSSIYPVSVWPATGGTTIGVLWSSAPAAGQTFYIVVWYVP